MKQLSLLTFMVITGFYSFAQDCKNFYFMTNNSEVKMTTYDRKGKESGIQTWTINDVKNNGSGFTSNVSTVFTDEKGKEITKGSGTYICENGMLKADIKMSMPQGPAQGAKMDGAYIEYPSNMAAGQTLKDANFEMDTETSGMKSHVTFNQTNRKVEATEKVTTPAGSWDAHKITYDGYFRIKMMGIGVPMNMKVTEWFVPNFGIVKSETYDKNGKLMASSMITSIKK
ncbi:MAG TPA: hypothetical protein VNA26_05850 [Chitinophagaceae bacterium]|nr:hypothetical protein [Chitinophagaceae bacterium]